MNNKIVRVVTVIILVVGIYIGWPFFKYSIGLNQYKEGNYLVAKNYFVVLEDFKDSSKYITECDYQIANEHLNKGEYNEALQIFNNLGEYKNSDELINECTYKQALVFAEEGKYNNAINALNEIIDYKDASIQIKEIQYNRTLNSYKQGYFITARTIGEESRGYKDIDTLIENSKLMEKYEGIWKSENGYSGVVISKWNMTRISYMRDQVYSQSTVDTTLLKDGSLGMFEAISYEVSSDGNTLTKYNLNMQTAEREDIAEVYTKISSSTNIPEPLKQKERPYIGMSRKELEESSWGKPRDINTTTYQWGVNEQWCYSGYRYVYLEDGVVTAIQE